MDCCDGYVRYNLGVTDDGWLIQGESRPSKRGPAHARGSGRRRSFSSIPSEIFVFNNTNGREREGAVSEPLNFNTFDKAEKPKKVSNSKKNQAADARRNRFFFSKQNRTSSTRGVKREATGRASHGEIVEPGIAGERSIASGKVSTQNQKDQVLVVRPYRRASFSDAGITSILRRADESESPQSRKAKENRPSSIAKTTHVEDAAYDPIDRKTSSPFSGLIDFAKRDGTETTDSGLSSSDGSGVRDKPHMKEKTSTLTEPTKRLGTRYQRQKEWLKLPWLDGKLHSK